jgi:membrane-associated phospholipid phosphatase
VAATVAAAVTAWQGSRRLGLILLPPTVFLTVGVVYCQMHYAVDAVAGLVVGSVIALLVSGSVRRGQPSEPQTIEGLR